MERGELFKKAQRLPVDIVRGVREGLQRREDRKYGTPEQRKFAYTALHSTFCSMFERFQENVVVVPGGTTRRLSVTLPDIGLGIIDEQDRYGGNYRLQIISKPVSKSYGGHFTESRKKQAIIETDGVQATVKEGYQGVRFSNNWSPLDGGYWDTFNKFGKTKPLDAQTAQDLAYELSQLPSETQN